MSHEILAPLPRQCYSMLLIVSTRGNALQGSIAIAVTTIKLYYVWTRASIGSRGESLLLALAFLADYSTHRHRVASPPLQQEPHAFFGVRQDGTNKKTILPQGRQQHRPSVSPPGTHDKHRHTRQTAAEQHHTSSHHLPCLVSTPVSKHYTHRETHPGKKNNTRGKKNDPHCTNHNF